MLHALETTAASQLVPFFFSILLIRWERSTYTVYPLWLQILQSSCIAYSQIEITKRHTNVEGSGPSPSGLLRLRVRVLLIVDDSIGGT